MKYYRTHNTDSIIFRRQSPSQHGFTLVELLVVIGIIALLISILLPALGKARHAANTLVSLSNLHSIMQSVHVYASQNNGYFPGGVHTSARFLEGNSGLSYDDSNCPSVVQSWDWQSPIADAMGHDFNHGPSASDRLERYHNLINYKAFQCPENQFLAGPYLGSVIKPQVEIMNSYVTAAIFHYKSGAGGPTPGSRAGVEISATFNQVPTGYSPQISAVGPAARKIFIADGARYSSLGALAPDVDLSYKAGYGGAYADVGSFSKFTASWGRGAIPGNGTGFIPFDLRNYAFRHGSDGTRNSGAYRFNAAFFDGHAETMDDLTGSNPELWMPTGTLIPSYASEVWPDVVARWPANRGSDYVAP